MKKRPSRRDADVLRDVLRRRLLRAMITAAGTLRRVCRGESLPGRATDDQREALRQIWRLAPGLVGVRAGPRDHGRPRGWDEEEEERDLVHPNVRKEEADRLLDEMQAYAQPTADEAARFWGNLYREDGPEPGKYASEAEANDYGRRLWEDIAARNPEFRDVWRKAMERRAAEAAAPDRH